MENKSVFLLTSLLSEFEYSIDKRELSLRLLSDPNNIVTSITNTLDYFNIENVVANVPKSAFNQLPKHFISQVSNGEVDNLVFVSKSDKDNVVVKVDSKNMVSISKDEFFHNWSGLIIAIEKNKSKEKKRKVNGTFIFLMVCLSSILLYTFLFTNSVLKTLYSALSILGFYISYIIIKEKLGLNTIVSRFCSFSKTTDCKSVLNSKNAKLLFGLDLSDLGIVYFLFLIVAFIPQHNSFLFFSLSLVSFFIIFYSLYQQYFEIKKWCPLCLGVVFILITQFFVLLPLYDEFHYSHSSLLFFIPILSSILYLWVYGKPLLVLKQKNHLLEIENLSFRRDHKLFLPYYNSLNKVDTRDDIIREIQLGSKQPIIKITAITNPLCKSCKEAHSIYEDLLIKFPESVQIGFRFLVSYKKVKDMRTQISKRLLELYFNNDIKDFNTAFNEWYNKTDSKNWLKKWGQCTDIKIGNILSEQVNWCLNNNIDSTPKILINGKILPDTYRPKDIENFIESIIEIESSKSKYKAKIA